MAVEVKEIIVGDIGGTNVRLAIARVDERSVVLSSIWKQRGERFPTFAHAVESFLTEKRGEGASMGSGDDRSGTRDMPLAGAAFGLAGPVVGGRVELLHRNWTVDAAEVGARLNSDAVVLVNDFVAMARSAPELLGDDVSDLVSGQADPQGNIVVGGPGTGFGLGTLKRMRATDDRSHWIVVGGEGGHQMFAPQNQLEWELAQRLRAQGVYVSNEVIASGSGFEETLDALAEVTGNPATTRDPAELLVQAKEGNELASQMCRLRARCTMSALGDAALAANATGGVFVAGGVSAYLRDWLVEPEAIACFRERGLRSALLAQTPIRLITGDRAALIGVAALWRDQQERGWI